VDADNKDQLTKGESTDGQPDRNGEN